ncbi:MAG: hypothetical protein ACJATT_004100 [Myxococcota bacterium]|jgi:hypothetical protein
MTLSAQVFVPDVAGELMVDGEEPDTAVRLIRGRNGIGEGACLAELDGACLGLLPDVGSQQVLLSDSACVTRFAFTPSASAADRDFALQAVSLGLDGTRTSNPLAVTCTARRQDPRRIGTVMASASRTVIVRMTMPPSRRSGRCGGG